MTTDGTSASAYARLAAAQTAHVFGRDLAARVAWWSEQCPDKPFLIWAPFEAPARTITWAQGWAMVGRIAAGLAARGIGRGDRFVVHMDNCPEFVLVLLAALRLGAVAVTTNTRSTPADMDDFIRRTDALGIITQPHHAAAITPVALARPDAAAGRWLIVVDAQTGLDDLLTALVVREDVPLPPPAADALRDPCVIQFTSGTTSRPKGVIWTRANLIWAAEANARNLDVRHDDVVHVVLPLFHTNAQSYSLTGAIWAGATLLIQPRFSASQFWPAAVTHRATWASLIPFCVKAALAQGVPADHVFRQWVPAVALPDLVDRPHGIRTIGLWGMTETVTPGIVGDIGQPGAMMCIGRTAPQYLIEVRDAAGQPVGPGESGRLFIQGVPGISLFAAYLDDPAATAAAVDAEGWLDTGDRVRIADNGDLFFMDRDKDMLKVGGENVAASEIETVITATGLVAEVAVVGQPHAMLDEVPVAFVIPAQADPDEAATAALQEAIIAACRARLANFKVVRAVYVVPTLPRATLEKIAKATLRANLPVLS